MRPAERELSGHSLLAVFAHPDDESLACGGLLARCAAGGARVSLLCLTHGEHGPGVSGPGRLRDARALELTEAAALLGVRDVVLLDHEDGMLPWMDRELLESDIADAIHRFDPDVVVTFDEDGLYWHPDHIAVHERTTAVVAGLEPAAPALLYVTIPKGAMAALVEAGGGATGPEALLGVGDVDAFGSRAPAPTLRVEAGRFAEQKLAALRCHRTQVQGGPLDRIEVRDAARLLGSEQYRRAEVGAPGEVFVERLGTRPTESPSAS